MRFRPTVPLSAKIPTPARTRITPIVPVSNLAAPTGKPPYISERCAVAFVALTTVSPRTSPDLYWAEPFLFDSLLALRLPGL